MYSIEYFNKIKELLNIGFEFEFFSNLKSPEEVAKSLSEKLNKRIVIPYSLENINNPRPLYHSPISATKEIFKLEPDYSGGENMFELITGPLTWNEAKNIFIKVCEWIDENGYTTDRSGIHINLSAGNSNDISKLNILYFILSFDEENIYNLFPNRRDSVYARSIKRIYPNKLVNFNNSFEQFNKNIFITPSEKYYGVNFTKLAKGYLEYRYLGGNNWHKRKKDILELLKYFSVHLVKVLDKKDFIVDKSIYNEWKNYVEKYKKIFNAFVSAESFIEEYKNIKLFIDLKQDMQILKTFWNNIKDKIYSFFIKFDFKNDFLINYDSDKSAIEIKGAEASGLSIEELKFFDCKLDGVFKNCVFINCQIDNSRINTCKLKNTKVSNSKVEITDMDKNCVFENCFIDNKNLEILGTIEGGVIKSGKVSEKFAKVNKAKKVNLSPQTQDNQKIEKQREEKIKKIFNIK